MSSKLLLTVALLFSFSASACSRGDGLAGSGALKTESRSVSGFNKVAVSGVGQITITQTGVESLTIEAEENLLPRLTSKVKGGTLDLGTEKPISPTKPVRYTVTVKDIKAIELSGATEATVNQIAGDAFDVSISGAGAVTASGTVSGETIEVSGLGKFDGSRLTAKTAKVEISGAGLARVNASDAVKVEISGTGKLEYSGDPKITKDISGLGTIEKH